MANIDCIHRIDGIECDSCRIKRTLPGIPWVSILNTAYAVYTMAKRHSKQEKDAFADISWITSRIRKQLAAGRLAQRQVEAMRREADRWSKDANWCAKAILAAGDIQEEE